MIRLLAALLVLIASPAAAQKLDATPRTAVMTAFPPEWFALVGSVTAPAAYKVNGLEILTGTNVFRLNDVIGNGGPGFTIDEATVGIQIAQNRATTRD